MAGRKLISGVSDGKDEMINTYSFINYCLMGN
jgi:hypothetical protein